ncbi:MAG: TIGR01212 family radical SAM protein [Firmicutes bacterium]|nr:TIGR01212 family radical SAM protein [Bacillota bacterium]
MASNPFPYSIDGKRYHTLAYERRRQGYRVDKAAVDAGFSCPNRVSRREGGCLFCRQGSGYFTAAPLPLAEQLRRETARLQKAGGQKQKTVAYFQAYTNTFAPLEQLRRLYEEALAQPGIEGLAIATRPDALPPEVIEYLAALNRRVWLSVELGLQTADDDTARAMGRGYDRACFTEAYQRLRRQGIRVCVHLICGLPGEDLAAMEESARWLGQWRPPAVKIHSLHVLADTPLADWYRRGLYRPLTLEEYVTAAARQLTWLPPETVIERITGDGDRRYLLAPRWSLHKLRVLSEIDRYMAEEDLWQGKFFTGGGPKPGQKAIDNAYL